MSAVDLSLLYYGPQGEDAEWVCAQVAEWITADLGKFIVDPVVYTGLGMFEHPQLEKTDAPRILKWFVDTFGAEVSTNQAKCQHETLRGSYVSPLTCDKCGRSFGSRPGSEYKQVECGRTMVYKLRAQNSEDFCVENS